MVPMKSNGSIFPEFMPRLFSINPWVNGELSDFEDFFSKTGILSSVPSVNISDKIDANYTTGILRLIIPKKEVTTTKFKKEVLIS